MKMGKGRIIIGCILIVLQIMSVLGNLNFGFNFEIRFDSAAIFLYDVVWFSAYFLTGVIGIILLCSGLAAGNKGERTVLPQDEPQKEEQATHVTEETEEVSSEMEIQKTKRQRYCKFCGGEIHPKTKKCAKCGKQYFVFKKHAITIILAVLLLVSVVANFVLLMEVDYYEDEAWSQKQYAWRLEEENEKQQNWLDVYEQNVVLIEKGTKVYHKRGCNHMSSTTVNVGWKLILDDSGYEACPHCCK